MKSFGHLVLVTLLVIAIALSTSLAESQASSSAKQQATATRLETQQNQQQRQPHKQRTHHHHHRQQLHPQERTRPEDVQQIRANNKNNADDAAQEAQQQQHQQQQLRHQQQQLKQHHRQKQSRQLSIQQQQHQQQQQQPQQHHHHHQHEIHRRNATTAETTETAPATAPRFRRISARDYYNQVTQGRSSPRNSAGNANEWSYNNYNVHTNTFGGPSMTPGRAAGKGDDNTQDVEFIDSSSSHSHIDWSAPPLTTTTTTTSPPPPAPARRSYSYDYVPPLLPGPASHVPRRSVFGTATATSAPPLPPPPPILPARRGYAAVTPATPSASADDPHTEDPFEGNTIGRSYPMDPQEMERRHICVQQRTIQMPVKTTEIYTRPIWKHINTPCQPQMHVNQMCTRVQLVHEPTYRDVIRHKSAQQVTYDCCAGWMREKPHMESCLMPICSTRCQNGGSCSGPDTCSCPSGFAGRYCEHDINECKEEKPCDQTCVNTLGSYYCKCRDGFILQDDQQSCKKIDLHDDDAFEARDLENEIESNDNVAARLQKIERSLANERVQTYELKKSLQATYHAVDSLKSRLNTLEKQQQDINRLQSNLFATETRTNKLESMLSLLMKCRIGPNAHCP